MTTRHSLFTRGLSLLLALVMVFSNMSGLTLTAKAAEVTLGDVLMEHHDGEDIYNVVLANVEALPKVAEILETAVEYPDEVPEEIAGSMVNGLLTLEPVDGWVPAYYNVDGFNDIPYEGPVQLDAELEVVYVAYEKDLGVAEQVNAANEYLKTVGSQATMVKQLLDNVSNSTALTALSFLDVDFINDMIDEVENLTLEDLDDEEATEEDLAQTKSEYVAIIGQLLKRLVEGNDPYMSYLNKKGEPEYENYLVVYAMLAEYDDQGLYHYYENKAYIDSELKELSSVLYDILGEKKNGKYENEGIVDALLENMGHASQVNASQLGTMAARMSDCAYALPNANYTSHVSEVDLTQRAAVDALVYAPGEGNYPPISVLRNYLEPNLTVAEYYEVYNEYVEETEPTTEPEPTETEPVVTEPVETEPVETEPVETEPVETEPSEPVHVHDLVHVEAVEAGCHYNGNIEHWYCTGCETVWQDEALTQITNHKSVIIPATGSNLLVHMDAVEAGCHSNGNIEHWICYECEQVWADEALTQVTNIKNVVVPAVGGEVEHFEAIAPACHYNGQIEHWVCYECEQVWADEALTQVTNIKNVVLPALGGEVEHFEAIAPACHYDGQVEHWVCYECEQVWADEALTQVTNIKNVVLPATGGEVIHVEAKNAACYEEGNIEYWYCEECEQVWQDAALTQLTNHKNVLLGAAHVEIKHVEAVAPSCFEEGNIEHWYCTECDTVWADEALTQITNHKNVILPAQCAEVKHVEAKTPSCYEEGNIEYWYCEECGQFWQDENLMQLTNSKNVILPAACQSIVHVDAVDSTCYEDGNVEYWYCEDCERFWLDAALTQVTNYLSTKTAAGCKTIRHIRATKPSCYEEGNVKYWYCADCERFWLDAERTRITNSKSVILPAACQDEHIKHVEAKAPDCENEGNIEYWYCELCETVWQDEDRMQITNFKNVIVAPAHTDVVHVEAVAARCHFEGNVEHWYCADCDLVCTDEDMTQVTNHKRVITPALNPDIEPVKAVRATCFKDGNAKYWYCDECGQYSLNEAFTELTDKEGTVVKGGIHTPILGGILKLFLRGATKSGVVTESDAYYSVDTCLDCDDPSTDHATTETIVITEPTCTEPGQKKTVSVIYLNGVRITSEMESVQIVDENGELVTIEIDGSGAIIEEIDPLGHDLVEVEGVEPGCHYQGVQKHWYCKTCEIVWTDEALTQVSNHLNVIIPALRSEAEYVEAKEPTCYENGNVEYWTCAECEQVWADEALTQLTNIKNVQIAPSHNPEYVAETCEVIEHWVCYDCESWWTDEALTQVTNYLSVIKAEPTHALVAVDAVSKTCYEDGNIAYWYCEECEKVWADEALTQVTNFKNVITSAAHDLVHIEAVEPGCHYAGNVEHWYCKVCDTVWTDEALTKISNHKNVIIPAVGGEVVHVEAKTPTCYENGNIEYWYCEECEQVWQNEVLTQLTNRLNVIVPADCTNIFHVEAVEPGCHFLGNVEYWHCGDCGTVWTDENRTQISNRLSVILPELGGDVVHVEAVAPGCENEGNIEYWYCEKCEKVWQDEALTQLTNIKNVVLPITHEPVHMEAVEPGCHYTGNIEYWYCADCDMVWADEGQTQVTNHKNVILPELGGEVEHVEAKEPTLHENGNIEYWYCKKCEQVWQDEARTQLTNIKNVVNPSVDSFGNSAEEPIEVTFVYDEETNIATASVTLGRGVWNLSAYGINGMILTANGEEIEYVPGMGRMMPATFQIINMGYEDVEYTLKGVYPVGHMMNPVALVEGKNTAVIEEGNDQGYYFTWTAKKTGTLKLTMPEGNWTYAVTNLTTGVNETYWSDSESVNPYVLVNKGDEVQIMVNNYDPENQWNVPAGELTLEAEILGTVRVRFYGTSKMVAWSSTEYQVGYALTADDLDSAATAIEKQLAALAENDQAAYDKIYFNRDDFVAEYTGYVVKETTKSNDQYPLKSAAFFNGEKKVVTSEGTITLEELGCTTKGFYLIELNGEQHTFYNVKSHITVELGSKNEFKVVEQITALKWLAAQLNGEGEEKYVVSTNAAGEETLTANITAGDIVSMAQGIFDATFPNDNGEPIKNAYIMGHEDNVNRGFQMDGIEFIYNEGGLKVNMNALVQALLNDAEFSSENLIKMGENGKGELLHTTITTRYFQEIPFTINLTSTPAQMAQVAELLTKARGHFWFEAGEGALDVSVNVPEKAYEALTAYALLTGEMDKVSVDKVANMAALIYVEEMISMLQDPTITVDTYNNTLQMLGVDKNLDKYAGVYNFLKDFVNGTYKDGEVDENGEFVEKPKFKYSLGEKTSSVDVVVENVDINSVLTALGMGTLKDLTMGLDVVADREIVTQTTVTIENEVPGFDAIILDPTRVANMDGVNHNTSLMQKANAINMTTNLSAQLGSVYGASAIMLIDNVNGDLTFNHTTILDLNGKTVNGSIIAANGAKVIVVDSSIETVSGAKVTGSVSGDVVILAGTYNADVSAFLRDGYYQDKTDKSVKNAMYVIEGGKLLVDPALYIDNVDGYLPAAHYLAAEIAVDIALNYYTAAGLYVNGKVNDSNMLYNIDFEDLVGLLGSKSAGLIVDEVLTFIDTPALSDFINKILADLVNVDKVAANAKTGEVISTYTFAIRPWTLDVEHIYEEGVSDYLTASVTANADLVKYISLGLAIQANTDREIEIPKIDKSYTVQEILDELAKVVVTQSDDKANGTNIEVMINQPVRDGKNLVVGGSAKATINLDFSHNENYNRILGAALAYFHEDLTKDLVKNGCIVKLNEVLAEVTVGEFFDTVNKVVQSKEVPFEKIAAKLELDLTAEQLSELNKLYNKFQNGVAKVIAKFDLDVNPRTPLSDLVDNDGNLSFDADIQHHSADVFYKGFGLIANLDYSEAKVIIKLAKGEHTPGEPVIENDTGKYYDQVVYCELCGKELSRETKERYLLGDVNLDDVVDFADLTMVTRKYMGDSSQDEFNYIQETLADVNCMDGFEFGDVTILTRYYMKDASQDWEPIYIDIDVE